MSRFRLLLYILVNCLVASFSFADIYEWTDENGVKHFTNGIPPSGAKILMKTKEVPYDEAADRLRMETEKEEQLELARLEIAQRKSELELREAEAERKLAAADRLVQEARQKAEYYPYDSDSCNRTIYRSGGSRWCRNDRWRNNYRHYDRWYYHYRPGRTTYKDKFYKRTHYDRHRSVKKHFGTNRKKYYDRSRHSIRYRHQRHYSTHKLKTHRNRNYQGYRGHRSLTRGGGLSGRGFSGFGRSGR